MGQPIFPADNPWDISGLMLSPIVWDEIFEATFSKNVDGVHAVLTSETESYTYTIADGRVESFQKGDIHETKFDEDGVSVNLTWSDLHSMGAPMYKLSLCECLFCKYTIIPLYSVHLNLTPLIFLLLLPLYIMICAMHLCRSNRAIC